VGLREGKYQNTGANSISLSFTTYYPNQIIFGECNDAGHEHVWEKKRNSYEILVRKPRVIIYSKV
jgi:hypothetical protein